MKGVLYLKEEVQYTSGDIAKDLGLSKTTVLNYIKEFHLEVRKNPNNGYRYFTVEDLQQLRDIHKLCQKNGKEQALKEWNLSTRTPIDMGEALESVMKKYKEEEQTLKQALNRQEQINQALVSEVAQLKSMVQGISSTSRQDIEEVFLDRFPSVMKEVLQEKDQKIDELKQKLEDVEKLMKNDRDAILLKVLRETQETKKEIAAMKEEPKEKSGFFSRLLGK